MPRTEHKSPTPTPLSSEVVNDSIWHQGTMFGAPKRQSAKDYSSERAKEREDISGEKERKTPSPIKLQFSSLTKFPISALVNTSVAKTRRTNISLSLPDKPSPKTTQLISFGTRSPILYRGTLWRLSFG
ncbi:hypothetical protein JTE90_000834 [Oedothorax gibbosus]|uniref:Uncharacterized protein n=1 Tax=Oedothorax gibbosus TaxID=931172 RepID=A0AAV6VSV6_9ARAC|nr:hypothetical protein JTE90_000834 [Oedothorax gibbosus]